MKKIILNILLVISGSLLAQNITKSDTLFGSISKFRSWWDVKHYDISIKPDYNSKTITGTQKITYQVIDTNYFVLQIDLQEPMKIDSVFLDEIPTSYKNYTQENNFYFVTVPGKYALNSQHKITIYFSGKPHEAKNAPWDGGWVWKNDLTGNPWMSVACQGKGPSIWYPCKDIQSDEPDNGCKLNITVHDSLVAIGNGKLISKNNHKDEFTTYSWEVKNPINNYNIVPYIGKYILLHDSVIGEKGNLITDYWVLHYNKQKAIQHLKPNVTKTIKCFENWFGPYPFYNDSYKIVEAPYLGMEHQSNMAYGNYYLNGYAGRDLSNTGWGLKWDFIVVHESGHEWFGNNITASDVADNWIHEGFTSYSEVLFTECEFGKEAGSEYCIGVRKSIQNDEPIIGIYGVHKEGSGDMYNKGSQVVNMIRQILNNDEKFKLLLREMNQSFYHKTVTTKDIETFICDKTGIDFIPFFNQYLRTTQIPKFEYMLTKNKLQYRYTNCLNEFTMPIKIKTDEDIWITPTTQWKTLKLKKAYKTIAIDKNFYVE
jgi:aminopeptidase N